MTTDTKVEFRLLKVKSNTWDLVWQQLEQEYGDRECINPSNQECWQYMGSVLYVATGRIQHQFRHRALPAKNGKREHFNIWSSSGRMEDFE